MTIAAWLLAALSVIVALDRLGLWMESRGWIYYRTKRGSITLGTAALEVQALLDPGKQHALEAMKGEASEDDESGDPPTSGRRRLRIHGGYQSRGGL
jgi:hypothetical protein